jgi:hypothetical protein
MDAEVRATDAVLNGVRTGVEAPLPRMRQYDQRTRLLLEGSIAGTLLRLAAPNVLVMFGQARCGLALFAPGRSVLRSLRLGLAFYFASVGAGRLLWPLIANMTRLFIAAIGGWLALRWGGDLTYVFAALSAALAAFGLINARGVASGAWFSPVGSPRSRVLVRGGHRRK